MEITTEDSITHSEMKTFLDLRRKKIPKISPLVKNRRYKKLEQLIEAGEYFSEESIRMRRPIIYHLYVGRYKRSGDFNESTMTDFLLDFIQKNEYQAQLLKELSSVTDQTILKKMLVEKEIDAERLSYNEDELIQLMHLMFLAGEDKEFTNYEEIDTNQALDDQKLRDQDLEDQYFNKSDDMEEEQENQFPNGGSVYTGIQDF